MAQNFENEQMRQAMANSMRENNANGPTANAPPPTSRSILDMLKETCLDMDDLSNGNETCTVCFEPQHVGDLGIKLPCGHCFHKDCVWPWLTQHSTCPVCRLDLNQGKTTNMGRREEKMRAAHLNNLERRRRQHTQTVAESRKRMQVIEQEEERRASLASSTSSKEGPKEENSGGERKKEEEEGEEGEEQQPKKRKTWRDDGEMDQDAKTLLVRLGLHQDAIHHQGEVDRCIGGSFDKGRLKKFGVSELRQRLKYLEVDTSTFLDKHSMVEALSEKSKEIVASNVYGKQFLQRQQLRK